VPAARSRCHRKPHDQKYPEVCSIERFDSGYWRRSDGSGAQAFKFRNPFAFWTVISFALFFGAVIVVGRLVGEWLGGVGAIVGAASGANREFKRAIRV
jgi:hypothetical protein